MLMTALAPMAGASILPAVASTLPAVAGASSTLSGAGGLLSGLGGKIGNFFSNLGSGGMGGFLGGFGDAVTGLPASQLFGIQDSPTAGLGKLLGGGLLGDFSGVGRSAMLGGAMGGAMAQSPQELNQQGMQMNQMMDEPPQFAFPQLPPMMMNNQQMLQPLNTQIDPRTIMSGLLAPRNYNII